MAPPFFRTVHGGPDALGVPLFDFSTNANACGPCPVALEAVQDAPRQHYPDPAYTQLRARLAAFHGVAPERIVLAASASEFIHRITALAVRSGVRHALLPRHGYGDYRRAAQVWAMQCHIPMAYPHKSPSQGWASEAALHWACEPSSPLGQADTALTHWALHARPQDWYVLDCAYAPLRLDAIAMQWAASCPCRDAHVWQLYSPNKALGLTGVRAAYALAPEPALADGRVAALQALAPSWPLGSDGVALLNAWVQMPVQAWLAQSRWTLARWKAAQIQGCQALGWIVQTGSLANFFTAHAGLDALELPRALQHLRTQGIKLRDCTSFDLPAQVRLGVLAPPAQQTLYAAWQSIAAENLAFA